MFNKHDLRRNEMMLNGSFARQGYDWWWHSFTARNEKTGEEKPFFIEFFICNPALGGAAPVLGQAEENKAAGKKPSYLMVKAGWWGEDASQLHRFFGWNDVTLHERAPYSVLAKDCYSSDTQLRGKIDITKEDADAHPEYMCGYGSIEWDLTIDKKIAYNVGYGAGTLLRGIKAFEMYWHAEGMKSGYSGYVICNGEKYLVTPETCFGYADKNLGWNFTSPWVWLSSCSLTSNLTGKKLENSVFDIGGGRPKIYFLALERKLLGAFFYEGKEFEFNFSKFWTLPKTEFESKETEDKILWHVRQENARSVMITDVECLKKDMIFVNYESPDGKKRHNRLWNGGSGTGRILLYRKERGKLELIDDVSVANMGCEYGEYDQ